MKQGVIKHKAGFGPGRWLKAVLPAYFFPATMSGLSGYLAGKPDLVQASYTTIAVPSLVAAVLAFAVLAQCQKRQVWLLHRVAMAAVLGGVMLALAYGAMLGLGLRFAQMDILPSAFLGGAATALANPLKKIG